MKTFTRVSSIALIAFATLAGCGGGGGGGGGGGVTTPPTPVADQSPSGIWGGQAVTAAGPNVTTSFEFNASGPFSVGTAPFTGTFSSGNAETRSIPGFYISGLNAWHVLIGTPATVTFGTLPSTLSFWVRTESAAVASTIDILDSTSALITSVTPTNFYQQITVNRTAAQTPIGSITITGPTNGDVVIDDFEFGFLSTTDDVDCVIAETLEFVCIVTDVTTDAFLAGAQGTVQINGSQVTGSGTLVAAPGTMLADGSTVANLTITGTASEGSTLNLTIAAAGVSISVSTTFEALYNRARALATVDGNYSSFDLFGVGDLTSFSVNNGVITSASMSGCVGNGQITIIDAAFNAYDVALDVTSCGVFNGMYDGLGVTADAAATDDGFNFAVFTTSSVIFGAPTK
jgi:hypothetical protein